MPLLLPERTRRPRRTGYVSDAEEGFGLLVQVSFDIAAFTLPAYRRGRLPRPSIEVSS